MTTVVLHLAHGRAWLMVSLLLLGFAGGMLPVVREPGTGGGGEVRGARGVELTPWVQGLALPSLDGWASDFTFLR